MCSQLLHMATPLVRAFTNTLEYESFVDDVKKLMKADKSPGARKDLDELLADWATGDWAYHSTKMSAPTTSLINRLETLAKLYSNPAFQKQVGSMCRKLKRGTYAACA